MLLLQLSVPLAPITTMVLAIHVQLVHTKIMTAEDHASHAIMMEALHQKEHAVLLNVLVCHLVFSCMVIAVKVHMFF